LLPLGDKENDTEFWGEFFASKNEEGIKKMDKLGEEVSKVLRELNKCNF